MPNKQFTQKQILDWMNLTAQHNGIAEKLGGAYKPLKINDPKLKSQFKLHMTLMQDLSDNFIMKNIMNVIRSQRYSDLKNNKLSDLRFSHFFMPEAQGAELIYEDTIITSPRTGNMTTDQLQISPEPDVEIKILDFIFNYAGDMRENMNLQQWASLPGFTGWINDRYVNLQKSLDKPVYNFLANEIKTYGGYSEIIIDISGLTDDEVAVEFEKVILESVQNLSGAKGYQNDLNEEVDSKKFDNIIDPKDIGIFLSTKNQVNRLINYIRKQVNMPGAENDFGVGDIQVMELTEDNEVIIIPKQKFIWGKQEGSGDTPLGYSLHNLKTDYVFFNSLFMLSAPSVRITGIVVPGATEDIKEHILDKQKARIEKRKKDLEKRIKIVKSTKFEKVSIKNNLEQILNAELAYHKALKPSTKEINFIIPNKVKLLRDETKSDKDLIKDLKAEVKEAKVEASDESKKEIAKFEQEINNLESKLSIAKDNNIELSKKEKIAKEKLIKELSKISKKGRNK